MSKTKNGSETKFYSGMKDGAFKAVFLDPKNRDLLKAVIETVLGEEIDIIDATSIELSNPNANVKGKRIDARVKATGKTIQIEVNGESVDFYRPRNMAYLCNIYANTTLTGEDYTENKDIIQINLSKSIDGKELMRLYTVRDKDGNLFVKNFKIFEVDVNKMKELWYTGSKEGRKYRYIAMLALDKEELLNLPMEDDKIMEKYVDEIIDKNDDPAFQEYMSWEEDFDKQINTSREAGIKEGIKEGRKSGIKEGENKKALETAKNLLKENLDVSLISRATGLTIKEIDALK